MNYSLNYNYAYFFLQKYVKYWKSWQTCTAKSRRVYCKTHFLALLFEHPFKFMQTRTVAVLIYFVWSTQFIWIFFQYCTLKQTYPTAVSIDCNTNNLKKRYRKNCSSSEVFSTFIQILNTTSRGKCFPFSDNLALMDTELEALWIPEKIIHVVWRTQKWQHLGGTNNWPSCL